MRSFFIFYFIYNWFICTAARSLILDLVLTHPWFWDKPKLSVTFQTMKGEETFLILFWLTGCWMLILFKCHRTLDIAKTVMKERSYVHGKTDQIIHLSNDGKLEEVLCTRWSRYFLLCFYVVRDLVTLTCIGFKKLVLFSHIGTALLCCFIGRYNNILHIEDIHYFFYTYHNDIVDVLVTLKVEISSCITGNISEYLCVKSDILLLKAFAVSW